LTFFLKSHLVFSSAGRYFPPPLVTFSSFPQGNPLYLLGTKILGGSLFKKFGLRCVPPPFLFPGTCPLVPSFFKIFFLPNIFLRSFFRKWLPVKMPPEGVRTSFFFQYSSSTRVLVSHYFSSYLVESFPPNFRVYCFRVKCT